jgi:hypothetical protein
MVAAEDRLPEKDSLPEEDRMAAPGVARNWDENVSLDERATLARSVERGVASYFDTRSMRGRDFNS